MKIHVPVPYLLKREITYITVPIVVHLTKGHWYMHSVSVVCLPFL